MSEKETIWFVLDTNIYLHYQWFEDIPWKDILKTEFGYTNKKIGICVPLKVLQEISDKKDSERGKIQKRAKKISSFMGEVFLPSCRMFGVALRRICNPSWRMFGRTL